MMHTHFLKKTVLTSVVLFSSAFAQPLGLIGGYDANANSPYAAFVSSSEIAPISSLPATGTIAAVAINDFGQGIVGGQGSSNAYAAFISPSGIVTPINIGVLPNGTIDAVAINDFGQGIVGAQGSSNAYAALVSPSGVIPINTGILLGSGISAVAINDSGEGLIGGYKNNLASSNLYAAFVSPSGTAVELTLPTTNQSAIYDVAINASGQGIIGGGSSNFFGIAPAYAALVSSPNTVIPISPIPTAANTIIWSVAINASGQGIIGGVDNSGNPTAYAAIVSLSGMATPITPLPSGVNLFIGSVAINSSGQGIIGGEINEAISGPAYAAFVSPSGIARPIDLGLPSGIINSVAINDFGQAIIGGQDLSGTTPAYAAIVSPSGIVTQLNLGLSNGSINGVAILNQIPTGSLSGNNLIFANYINKNAPQDAFYFVPAYFDGTLSEALESAAPTRNAISLYTAESNLFYLMTGLSNHLHNLFMQSTAQNSMTVVGEPEEWQPEELMVSECLQKPKKRVGKCCYREEKNSTVWFEALGALAYQKEQHETPGFNPTTGGAILAYEGKTSDHSRVGAGATYLYTHVHEKQDAGHSNINQEDLFVYASWEKKTFYIDGSLLGGLFQISQVRNIHMTGFDFKSKSHPKGWQLIPHLEVGYKYMPYGTKDIALTFNPFIMVDWANAWQGSYKEKGSSPFNAGQKSHYSSLLRSEVSLRVYETVFFDAWNLIFQEKAGYVNVHSFKTGNVNAFLVGSPGAFTVATLTGSQNLGVAEFAMIFAPDNSNYPTGTIFYQGEFGSKYQSHQVAVELAWDF